MPDDNIYAQLGPFGMKGVAERERFEQWFDSLTPAAQQRLLQRYAVLAERVGQQHRSGTRPMPSDKLTSFGEQPPVAVRKLILDLAARQADQHGELSRNDQCVPFACYVRAMLKELGFPARIAVGQVTYKMNGVKHTMQHAWVELGDDVIDGNLDSLEENFSVPEGIRPRPYWGPQKRAPNRTFTVERELTEENEVVEVHEDIDVERELVLGRFRELQIERRPES